MVFMDYFFHEALANSYNLISKEGQDTFNKDYDVALERRKIAVEYMAMKGVN